MIQRKPTRFKRWIDAAPEILETATPSERSQARLNIDRFAQTKSTVLVCAAADGYIEVFGDTHIQAKILNVPVASSVENEIKVEHLVESVLPPRFKDVYWPGANRRANGNVKPITLKDVLRVADNIKEFKGLLGAPLKPWEIKKHQLNAMEA